MGAFLSNTVFWACFWAWFVAQGTKLLVHLVSTRELDFRYLTRLGGMPSAHSAMVVALAVSVGLQEGFETPIFAVALALAAVVMLDAQTVRHAAGQQARLLNQMVAELFKEHHLSQRRLVEFLGHTRLEVFFGLIMGVFIALLVYGCSPPGY